METDDAGGAAGGDAEPVGSGLPPGGLCRGFALQLSVHCSRFSVVVVSGGFGRAHDQASVLNPFGADQAIGKFLHFF